VAPLTIGFFLSSNASITQIALDLEGDGTVDFQGPGLEGQVFTYGTPGLYLPTASVTDATGATHGVTAPVRVVDLGAFDALLQAKWEGMKTALQGLDLPTALQFMASKARVTYEHLFTELAPLLATVGADLGDIRLVGVREDLAEYGLLVVEDGQRISYYVEFIRDADGLWRVNFF
jgi:hypothetical protein